MMGNRLLYKIECFHVHGAPETERLKVTALNPLHPTACSPLQKVVFHIMAQSLLEEGFALQLGRSERIH
jgi:hypothetical protein